MKNSSDSGVAEKSRDETGRVESYGPPEDVDMELTEHIAELRKRLTRIIIALVAGLVVLFNFSDTLIRELWNYLFRTNVPMVAFSPTEWIMARLAVSFVLSFCILYPYIVYELYLFAKPGLYEHERRFLKLFLPFSYVLFLTGAALALFVVLPRIYELFVRGYLGARPFLSVKRTLYSAFKVILAFGLAFQIPVLAAIAARLGLIDAKWLKEKRLIVYVVVFLLATNVTLDFTGFSQLVVLAVVVVMYEISIQIAKVMERERRSESWENRNGY